MANIALTEVKRTMRGKLVVVLVLALGFAAATLTADEVHLKAGAVIHGKIVEASDKQVRVKTRFGVQSFARRDVARIVYGATPAEEFAKRLKAVNRRDARALVTLARWAKTRGLRKQAKKVWVLVLEVDTNRREAHEALGHVKFKGRWMTPKEAERARAAAEIADRLARGLVEYKGKWVTREEMEARERGWIKVGDRWLPPEEANRARGMVRVNGEWLKKEEADAQRRASELGSAAGVKFQVAATPRVRVYSEFSAKHARQIADAAEKALAVVREKIGYGHPVWKAETPAEFVLLRTPGSFMRLTDLVAKKTGQPDGWAEFTKRRTSFYTILPPMSVQHLGGRRQGDMVFCAAHHAGHIALNGMFPGYTYLPVWLDEGFGAWMEVAVMGDSLTACATTGYGVGAVRKDKWSTSSTWKENLKQAIAVGSVTPVSRLLVKPLNKLGWRDIAKAWSVIDWWITTDPDKFRAFVRAVRKRYPRWDKHADCPPTDLARFQNEALQEVYGLDADGVEREWRKYVSARY